MNASVSKMCGNSRCALLWVLLMQTILCPPAAVLAKEDIKDWQLVLKAKSGVSHPDPYYLWLLDSYGNLNGGFSGADTLTSTFQGHYKSPLVSHWESLNVSEVKVALYSVEGSEELISFEFRGSEDRWSWFAVDHLLDSKPYKNAKYDALSDFFSITGSDRRFSIRPSSAESCTEIGWITMVSANGGCGWDNLRATPYFLYTRKPSPAQWPAWIHNENDIECYTSANGQDYRGQISTTESGRTCQKWTSQIPHSHSNTPEKKPDAGLGDHNFCRNPDEKSEPWCFTTDPNTRRESCNVGQPNQGCERFFDCKILGPDWIRWNQSCYMQPDHQQTSTWAAAQARCIAEYPSSHMAVANSEEENDFLQGLLPVGTNVMWLGCRDFDDSGNWSCLDNSPSHKHYYVESTKSQTGFWNWDLPSNQPNGRDEDCLSVGSTFGKGTSFWHDWRCNCTDQLFHAACEVQISSLTNDDEVGFGDSFAIFIKYANSVTRPVNCPADITTSTDHDSIAVYWADPSIPPPPTMRVSSSHQPGTMFPLGTTQVTYTFIDDVTGNTTYCRFVVTVKSNGDMLNGSSDSSALIASVSLGIILLIVLASGIIIHLIIRSQYAKQSRNAQNQDQPDNYYIQPIENAGNIAITNGRLPPLPTQPMKSSDTDEESTYEELKERPDPQPYTGLSAYAKPIDDSTRRKINTNRYEEQRSAPQYSNVLN